MKTLMSELPENYITYLNNSSSSVSAHLVKPKPGPNKWRSTVHLRPINLYIVQQHYLIPNLEQDILESRGLSLYANFDVSHGYLQLLLSPESQECQSFITPDVVFNPIQVVHGTKIVATFLQPTITTDLDNELQGKVLV